MNARQKNLLSTATQSLVANARSYRNAADKALAELGLSQATAWPIALAGRLGDGVRQGALAEAIGVEGPSLVRVLDQLVAANLMVRKEDCNDRRAKTLHLTEEGQALLGRIELVLDRVRNQAFDGASEADLEHFVRLMQRMKSNLGKGGTAAVGEDKP